MLNNYLRSPSELDFDANIRIISYSAKKIAKIAKKFSSHSPRTKPEGSAIVRNSFNQNRSSFVRAARSFIVRSTRSTRSYGWIDPQNSGFSCVCACVCVRDSLGFDHLPKQPQ